MATSIKSLFDFVCTVIRLILLLPVVAWDVILEVPARALEQARRVPKNKRGVHGEQRHAKDSTGKAHTHQGTSELHLPDGCKVCVFGSGSFGTALASHFARRGFAVQILAGKPDVAEAINRTRRNPRAFPDVELPPNLHATTDADEALRGAALVVHTVPAQATYAYLSRLRGKIHCPILSASKGITRDTLQLVHDVIVDALTEPAEASGTGLAQQQGSGQATAAAAGSATALRPELAPSRPHMPPDGTPVTTLMSPPGGSGAGGATRPRERAGAPPLAVFSGPTFARELLEGMPTGAVVASSDLGLARSIAKAMESPGHLRLFVSDDVLGVELAGALKNVYAIAAGAIEGVGWRHNTTSLLTTRAIAEMARVAEALGARRDTLLGLAGWGDLTLTCAWGGASRNRAVGVRLGRGEAIGDILASMSEVAEGVATAPAARALAQRAGVKASIINAVARVLEGAEQPMPAMMRLLALPTYFELGDSASAAAATGSDHEATGPAHQAKGTSAVAHAAAPAALKQE